MNEMEGKLKAINSSRLKRGRGMIDGDESIPRSRLSEVSWGQVYVRAISTFRNVTGKLLGN